MKDDSSFWVEDNDGQLARPLKRRRNRTKKVEFIGWGSRPLISFLDSIGKSTAEALSQKEVAAIINEYVIANNLLNPQKKKRILCDDRLRALFGKKTVPRMKIYDLLEVHFAENHDESEDEIYSSEEDDDVMVSNKGKKATTSERKVSLERKKVQVAPKSCFAAVIPENVKLVYLKRSLVHELSKIPESFEEKVKGCFVRIKSDPNDYLQKHPYHLQQVTGVRRAFEDGSEAADIQLQVTSSVTDIPLGMLSDDNFSEEECEDLRERVKAGLIKRPTIVEIDAKAKKLHEDIMKHWIPREIALLQKLIDRANEKGWRRELYEYLERKQLLQTVSEQQRLLLEMPEVVADELEPEAMDPSSRTEESSCSPKSILRGASDTSSADASGRLDAHDAPKQVEKIEDQPIQLDKEPDDVCVSGNREKQSENIEGSGSTEGISEKQAIPSEVIELSDDEEEIKEPETGIQVADWGLLDPIWNYVDPQGAAQGPFTILALKRWSDGNYFEAGFKVWRTGQSPAQAVLLVDLIRLTFHAG